MAECIRCKTKDDLLGKSQFQLGGDFGGPLLVGRFCYSCYMILYQDPLELKKFKDLHPESVKTWEV